MSTIAKKDSTHVSAKLAQQCVDTLRFLSVDMIQKADSGHPGLPLGAAPMAYVLWTKFLKHNPANPHWPDRDRFVLSAGHGSALLYSLLHVTGYDLSIADIKQKSKNIIRHIIHNYAAFDISTIDKSQ